MRDVTVGIVVSGLSGIKPKPPKAKEFKAVLINTNRFPRKQPTGEVVTLVTESGREKKIRLRSTVPKKCSSPRQICIKCTVQTIHKNSKNYDSKICEKCE